MGEILTTVRNKEEKNSEVSVVEQAILCFIAMAMAIVVIVAGAADRWFAAIFCTVPVFAGTISYFRNSWSLRSFWKAVALVFFFHLVLIVVIFGVILRHKEDVGLLICIPGIFLESFFI